MKTRQLTAEEWRIEDEKTVARRNDWCGDILDNAEYAKNWLACSHEEKLRIVKMHRETPFGPQVIHTSEGK
jgi:hypothetical protein